MGISSSIGSYIFCKKPDELIGHRDLVPDHLDNNGLNNIYTNLEWKTRGQNVSDAFKMGYINNSGPNHKGVFIKASEAHIICTLLEDDKSYDYIIAFMGYPNTKKYRRLLIRIKNGLAWKEISSSYNINKIEYKYSDAQIKNMKLIPRILSLHESGKSNSEIIGIMFPNEQNREKRLRLIRDVCNHRIFKSYIESIEKDKRSTTRES